MSNKAKSIVSFFKRDEEKLNKEEQATGIKELSYEEFMAHIDSKEGQAALDGYEEERANNVPNPSFLRAVYRGFKKEDPVMGVVLGASFPLLAINVLGALDGHVFNVVCAIANAATIVGATLYGRQLYKEEKGKNLKGEPSASELIAKIEGFEQRRLDEVGRINGYYGITATEIGDSIDKAYPDGGLDAIGALVMMGTMDRYRDIADSQIETENCYCRREQFELAKKLLGNKKAQEFALDKGNYKAPQKARKGMQRA